MIKLSNFSNSTNCSSFLSLRDSCFCWFRFGRVGRSVGFIGRRFEYYSTINQLVNTLFKVPFSFRWDSPTSIAQKSVSTRLTLFLVNYPKNSKTSLRSYNFKIFSNKIWPTKAATIGTTNQLINSRIILKPASNEANGPTNRGLFAHAFLCNWSWWISAKRERYLK